MEPENVPEKGLDLMKSSWTTSNKPPFERRMFYGLFELYRRKIVAPRAGFEPATN